MATRAVNDTELMSPPRPIIPPNLMDQSTPIRTSNPNPIPGTPDQRRGASLKSLNDGDRATLLLRVKEKQFLHKGIAKACENFAVRRNNPADLTTKIKISSLYIPSCYL